MGVSPLRATINVLKRRFSGSGRALRRIDQTRYIPGKSVSSTSARPDGEQGGGEKDSQISPVFPGVC
jgi:hypothetical protein